MRRAHAPASSRPSRWLAVAILWTCVGGRWGPNPARADDEPPPVVASPSPSPTEEPLHLQWFAVGTLTRGATWFLPARGPFPPRADHVNEEGSSLFGSEGEVPIKAFGSVTDIIDLVKMATPVGTWDREGFSINEQGGQHIVVRATPSTLDLVEAFLVDLEREAMRTVTFDCVVVRGAPTGVLDADEFPRALSTGALEPLLGARVVGHVGQWAVARTGGERAYLSDADVEVAPSAGGPDPIAGVLFEGLAVGVQIHLGNVSQVAATLHAWWAEPAPFTTHRSPRGDVLERSSVDGRSWNRSIVVKPGTWTLLPSTGGISLAVHATVQTPEPSPRGPPGLAPVTSRRRAGPLTLQRWAIRDLDRHVVSTRGSIALRLQPSHFAPPEPPELVEPARAFPTESLADVLKILLGPTSFDQERASLEVRDDDLWASVDADTATAISSILATLRSRVLATTRLRSTVMTLPIASFPEYLAGLDDGATLLADGGTALLRRPGARVIDRQALGLASGQRGAVVGGQEHAYLADYDIEIAEKIVIGNPIMRSWLEGISLDLEATRSLAGHAVSCEMRLERSNLRENRQVPTAYGPIDCPNIGVQRVSGAFTVPVGGSRIVAAHLENGHVTIVILGVAAE